jgi:hypothetical protein
MPPILRRHVAFPERLRSRNPKPPAAALLAVIASACAAGSQGDGMIAASSASEPMSFAVSALSRGTGVPERARAVLAETEEVVATMRREGADVALTKERIGLEGETRLCLTFADPSLARQALERVRAFASGVDLVDLTQGPCAAPR